MHHLALADCMFLHMAPPGALHFSLMMQKTRKRMWCKFFAKIIQRQDEITKTHFIPRCFALELKVYAENCAGKLILKKKQRFLGKIYTLNTYGKILGMIFLGFVASFFRQFGLGWIPYEHGDFRKKNRNKEHNVKKLRKTR